MISDRNLPRSMLFEFDRNAILMCVPLLQLNAEWWARKEKLCQTTHSIRPLEHPATSCPFLIFSFYVLFQVTRASSLPSPQILFLIVSFLTHGTGCSFFNIRFVLSSAIALINCGEDLNQNNMTPFLPVYNRPF